jgi:hypothetical protein
MFGLSTVVGTVCRTVCRKKLASQTQKNKKSFFSSLRYHFMPAIASTSGRLHSEFVRLLFLQAHRETDRFFAASGVQSAQSTSGGFFHFRRAVPSTSQK